MNDDLQQAIRSHQAAFGLDLSAGTIERLAAYYELILQHNPIMHLVGPCSAEEFAVRHILESLALLKHLPNGANFVDVGTGAGLPSIPCLLARDDLSALLIESKIRKAGFLNEAVESLGIALRATVINRQFEETTPDAAGYVACRALDKFTEKLPRLLKWSGQRTMLLYGGDNLRLALHKLRLDPREELLPMSDARFLFSIS